MESKEDAYNRVVEKYPMVDEFKQRMEAIGMKTETSFAMKPLLEHKCPHCGHSDESKLEIAGPHLKQICKHCGAYVKFVKMIDLPSVKQVRERIWEVANKDENLINNIAKKEIMFEQHEILNTWNLYLTVLEHQMQPHEGDNH